MNPGICYLYEYENDQKLRNVGFMKVTPQYHSCILQINARGIPVKNGDTILLLAFYENGSDSIAKPIQNLPCGEKTLYARLSLTDSEYPGGKILDDLGGFLLKTENGPYYAAVSDHLSFNTDKIKIWTEEKEAETSEESEKTSDKAETSTDAVPDETAASDITPETTESEITADAAETVIDSDSVMEAESLDTFPSTTEETDNGEDLYETDESVEAETVETEDFTTSEEVMVTNPNERFQDLWEEESMDEPSGLNDDSQDEMEQPPRENVRKIQRSDLSVLPRKSWNLANNSFLMHGYHNYNHLLLVEEDGHFWLGVPGIYAPREARAAELFGFPQFTQTYANQMDLNNDERDEDEKFGHWCRYIR